ncbi:hypothetical protein MXAN_5169 [Myxococcus xanthus DK 1622]|uniref:Uncharacterized protein n=2 Tax=Myxococcus TaxID=32 RepID=Q1D201_MYXXD|nr:hypothetical protein MXAN_5169 [Myxococcus xanthus DK 1622]NOJ55893.1 hypothetical protein [Myxococcus xanthus]QPM77675.1 hypothetical protein I5Q59_25580 [Myxococcus xanthus]QVW66741.1 hypothetical protein JTM82_30930 [Myxococcus xanthus DZ2]UEO07131.1 hypothetical protein K1515_11860 [Myxococcus xanthus DZ2]
MPRVWFDSPPLEFLMVESNIVLKPEVVTFKQLDPAKVDALRGQLSMILGRGEFPTMSARAGAVVVKEPQDHTSHTSDGWF